MWNDWVWDVGCGVCLIRFILYVILKCLNRFFVLYLCYNDVGYEFLIVFVFIDDLENFVRIYGIRFIVFIDVGSW